VTLEVTAKIVALFRIHEDAVRPLMSASFSEDENRRRVSSAANSCNPLSGNLMAALVGRSKRHSTPAKREEWQGTRLNEEISRYIEKLRALLERRQETSLF
jgi:hypothetical protein